VAETERVEGYPDRVIYRATSAGRETAHEWLREMLRSGGDEYPEFIAALSIMFVLAPEDVQRELELRAERLAADLTDAEAAVAGAPEGLPRLFLLEEEYRMTMLRAEVDWLRGVIDDLRGGRLTWSEEWLREVAMNFLIERENEVEGR
jgi:hypothetical protein